MNHYGVRRLIALNSGKYSYADIDLTKPVHLAAPNNRGKSTLVNALQFLYIDDFTKMKFGRRSHEDSRRHYFGADRSYLVFECFTTTGPQCMLVRGLSSLREGHFERYVYDGPYLQEDFVDGEVIRDFESIRGRLADRTLSRVNNSDLWQVLAGSLSSTNEKPIPRLSILPIRRREDYLAFRDVYVRLLSLSSTDARALRQLIIDSHAREVGERKIDVAAEYKDDFSRAERAEDEVDFVHSVSEAIDQGRTLRIEIESLLDKVKALAPYLLIDAKTCQRSLGSSLQTLESNQSTIESSSTELETEKERLLKEEGRLDAEANSLSKQWQHLQVDRERWGAFSSEMIAAMRSNAERIETELADQRRHLEKARAHDVVTLRNAVSRLAQVVDTGRQASDHWETTTVAVLRAAGIKDSQLDVAFRLANPVLLNLVVGQTITFREIDKVVELIQNIAKRVKNDRYSDSMIEVQLAPLPGPDFHAIRDRESVRAKLTHDEAELREHEARLKAAEDQEAAQHELNKKQEELDNLKTEVREFDEHSKAWDSRDLIEKQLTEANDKVETNRNKLASVKTQLTELKRRVAEVHENRIAFQQLESSLVPEIQKVTDKLRELKLYSHPVEMSDSEAEELADHKSLKKSTEKLTKRLSSLMVEITGIEQRRGKLQDVQKAIFEKSQNFEGQAVYFNDGDADWERLIEMLDSLPQREAVAAKLWDGLFTTLGARLKAIVLAVSNIKLAVARISRGIQSHQVSNLREVRIDVVEEHDTFSTLEALSEEGGLFQDREQRAANRTRLRQMIDRNVPIELESLFEIQIRVQALDESWQQANSLDEIGSTGTTMTVKAMIFVQLVRAIAPDNRFRLHFYIDGLGELDDPNLEATASMAVSRGIIPITADPRLHLEPLAHPEVTVYSLGQGSTGHFFIDGYRTYHARKRSRVSEVNHE